MKRLKFLMAFVFLLVGTLTLFSFTNEKYRKAPLFVECLKYVGRNPASPIDITDAFNWNSMLQNPSAVCFGGPDLCAICFDNSSYTTMDVLQALRDYYWATGSLPSNGQTIFYNGVVVQVYRSFHF